MKKCFSNFCKNQDSRAYENVNKESLKETYDSLKDLSGDELTQKLYNEVKKQKENGDFDFNALSENIERLKMFLPCETYENMKNMLEKLK